MQRMFVIVLIDSLTQTASWDTTIHGRSDELGLQQMNRPIRLNINAASHRNPDIKQDSPHFQQKGSLVVEKGPDIKHDNFPLKESSPDFQNSRAGQQRRKLPGNGTADLRIEKLQHILSYFLPLLCVVVLPFSALNIYLLILQDAATRPSYLLYANLLAADILTVVGGVCLVDHFKTENTASLWWFNNMIWLSFYTGVPLLFGLVLIRIVAAQVQAYNWLAHGYRIAKIVVVLSWILGLGVTLLHDSISFGTTGSVLKDVAIISVVVPTCVMNLYVWSTLRRVRSQSQNFAQASKTALLLFLNFLFCYAYFTGCYLFYIYTVITGDDRCSDSTWWGLLFCTNQGRHYVGECSMLLQSVGNNSILLHSSRDVLRVVWEYYKRRISIWWNREREALLG